LKLQVKVNVDSSLIWSNEKETDTATNRVEYRDLPGYYRREEEAPVMRYETPHQHLV